MNLSLSRIQLLAALLLLGARLPAQSPAPAPVPAGATLAAPAPAPAGGGIQGIARDAAGKPLADAYITVQSQANHSERNVTSGADGGWQLADLAPGGYTVSALHVAYRAPDPASVTVTAGQTSQLMLQLAPIVHVRTFWDKLWRIHSSAPPAAPPKMN